MRPDSAGDEPNELTAVAQDYLKVIWNAQEWSRERVSTKMLAEKLGVSASTASESIRKLAEQGLVVEVLAFLHRERPVLLADRALERMQPAGLDLLDRRIRHRGDIVLMDTPSIEGSITASDNHTVPPSAGVPACVKKYRDNGAKKRSRGELQSVRGKGTRPVGGSPP